MKKISFSVIVSFASCVLLVACRTGEPGRSLSSSGSVANIGIWYDHPSRQAILSKDKLLQNVSGLGRIVGPDQSICAGFRISPCLILSARHCADTLPLQFQWQYTAEARTNSQNTSSSRFLESIPYLDEGSQVSGRQERHDWVILETSDFKSSDIIQQFIGNKHAGDPRSQGKVRDFIVHRQGYTGECYREGDTQIIVCSERKQWDGRLVRIYGYPSAARAEVGRGFRTKETPVETYDCTIDQSRIYTLLDKCASWAGNSGGPIILERHIFSDSTRKPPILAVQQGTDTGVREETNYESKIVMSSSDLEKLKLKIQSCEAPYWPNFVEGKRCRKVGYGMSNPPKIIYKCADGTTAYE